MITMKELIQRAEDTLFDAETEEARCQQRTESLSTRLKSGEEIAEHRVFEATSKLQAARRLADRAREELKDLRAEHAEDKRIAELREQHVPTAAATFRGRDATFRVSHRDVYTREASERGERSYLVDLFRSQVLNDPQAGQRLAEHGATVPQQTRDATSSNVAGFTPPAYLSELWAEYARAGRPVVDLCRPFPLPAVGMTVNVPRLTTPTTVAVQASENTAVSNQDPDDTLISAPVRTLAGYADISRQAIERGENVDAMVMSDLSAAYNAGMDSQVINGDGTSGAHLGIRNIASVNLTTYTDASPTFGEMYVKLAEAAGKVMSTRYTGATACVMHPRLWASLIGQVDSDGRPLVVPAGHGPTNAGAVGDAGDYGSAGTLLGVPIVLSGNVPTNLGAGTNETCVIFADFRDIYVFEDAAAAPAQLRFDQPLSDQLTVRLVAYGYSAVVAGRQPNGISLVTGTGMILT